MVKHQHTMMTKMDSEKLVFSSIIVFLLIFFLTPCKAASVLDAEDIKSSRSSSSINSQQKVNLSVYYETLCLSCAKFIVQNVTTVFNNDLIDIINLRMIPWGNAHFNTAKKTIICEHGPDECELNTIQACAIDIWHNVVGTDACSFPITSNKSYAFIYCIEFLAIEGRHRDWTTCFDSLGLPEKPILDCYNNGTGAKLEASYSNETARLNPPLTFLPWLVVNDEPLRNDYGNFTTYICNAYKGTAVPNACKLRPPNGVSSVREGNTNHAASYGGEAKNLTGLRPIMSMPRLRKTFWKMPEKRFK